MNQPNILEKLTFPSITGALAKSATSLGAAALLVAAQGLVLVSSVSAEATARAHGRCKLSSDDYQAFDGYCTVKQKQRGGTTVFVIELDDGSKYRFFGPNKQALQVETHDGIHNVQFKEDPDKGVFIWQEDGERNRLLVKLDTQHPPDASHDTSTEQALGTVIGAGIGALIGNLLTGSQSSQSASKPAENVQYAKNPYDGKGYTATASFKCSVSNDSHDKWCPGGIMRKGNNSASITILFPNRYEVQYDFRQGNVTTTFDGNLTWGKQGDEWYIGIDRNLFVIIPDAAIYGD